MRLVSLGAVTGDIATASSVEMCAYALSPGSRIVRTLEAAGDRGAAVRVVLQGSALGSVPGGADLVARNAAVAADLRGHGVAVRLSSATDEPVHLKAAVVDGRAYLSDRNWASAGAQTIVALDGPAGVALVRAAIDGRPGADETFATDKAAALRLEAETIRTATGDRIDLETESFAATVVSTALETRMRGGAHVRLLVCEADVRGSSTSAKRERGALARLIACGAEVALTPSTEKLCVAGDASWVGSANQTFAMRPMLDWGARSDDRAIAASLEAAFEGSWRSARPVALASSTAYVPKRSPAFRSVCATTSSYETPRSSASRVAVAAM